MTRPSGRVVLAVATALVVLAVGLVLVRDPGPHRVSADFERTVGLFEGSDVRVMGLRVGKVTRITPHGTHVRVEMEYADDVDLPRGVKAVVIAPSVISDRFVQLTPGYVSGPVLASGSVIPTRDTRVPVELDQSLRTTTDLMTALGPDGANAHGALADTLRTMAGVLQGTGDDARSTLHNLSDLSGTLAASSPELAANLRQLSGLTQTLAASDRDVTGFNDALGAVARAMGEDSADLSEMLRALARALGEVELFVRDNRALLVRNVRQLRQVTTALAAERRALTEILDIAPLAFTNLTETYDPEAQAVRTRANFGEVTKILDQAVCDALVKQAGPGILPVCRRLHAILDAGARR